MLGNICFKSDYFGTYTCMLFWLSPEQLSISFVICGVSADKAYVWWLSEEREYFVGYAVVMIQYDARSISLKKHAIMSIGDTQ